MKKWLGISSLMLALALVASGCGGSGDKKESASSPAVSDEAGANAITLEAKNFEFNTKEIKVKKGDKVSITLKNTQGNHAVHIEGYDKTIKANATVTFVADKAGEFNFICSIYCGKGHDDMVGKLIVE
ncbi:MAG: cupredoxin domain-containing protein [Candidatus Cohnella colombiensis]|uniref:Cupredoxin domain-containing protein n=1 Tax=Candidatus Cohnella colombiensis TaxID=3121368 RepID=A0AA95EY13_9BACL|nr:MAG: cupredoxin domain-containing protein [Cohnella sp.]